jgi:primosomal replication protein N
VAHGITALKKTTEHNQPHRNTAKTAARILGKRTERKIQDVCGVDQFGFRRRKETRNAMEMLRITAERTFETDTDKMTTNSQNEICR